MVVGYLFHARPSKKTLLDECPRDRGDTDDLHDLRELAVNRCKWREMLDLKLDQSLIRI